MSKSSGNSDGRRGLGTDPFAGMEWIGKDRGEDAAKNNLPSTPLAPEEKAPPSADQKVRGEPSGRPRAAEDHREPARDQKPTPPAPAEASQRTKAQAGLPDGWTRATFIVRDEFLERIRDHAWWVRMEIKKVLDEALVQYFADKQHHRRPRD